LPAVGRVIVVDNGSTDATASVAAGAGATVVLEAQRGLRRGLPARLAAIRELTGAGRPPPRVVVFLDADYSDDPHILPTLVQPISMMPPTSCSAPGCWAARAGRHAGPERRRETGWRAG